jgi:hypothetical protein
MQEIPKPLDEVAAFLEHYKSAKIIVIIDTHCLDGGFFVYKGTSPATYEGCSLEEVIILPILLLVFNTNASTDTQGLCPTKCLQVPDRARLTRMATITRASY